MGRVRSARRSIRTAAGEDVGHTEAARAADALHHGRPCSQHDWLVFRWQNLFFHVQFHRLVSEAKICGHWFPVSFVNCCEVVDFLVRKREFT